MSTHSLDAFLSAHALKAGDAIAAEWKGMTIEGIILPQANATSSFLHVKLRSGYNTGLSLDQIKTVKKLESSAAAQATFNAKPATSITLSPVKDVEQKPGLALITAGGTIGSKTDYKTGGVNALMTPEELIALIPEIGSFAHFHTILSPFSKLSENITPMDWIQLATLCHHQLENPKVKGVLLTHGTDTIHYTAIALSFMLRNLNKPVVLVGAQRSSDRGSSDAPFNLICASRVALSDMAEVGICMHATTSDDYCFFTRGTRVRKMHTSRRDAFRPINETAICEVTPDGKMNALGPFARRDESKKVTLDAVFEPHVALIKTFPGMSASILEHYAEKGCKGFVIEGTGIGHVHTDWIPTIRKLTEKGIPVFITSQVLYGRINMNVYSNGRQMQEAGAVGLEDMLPEVAYVKLGWVLAHTKDVKKVKEMMLTNYAGEISPVSSVESFLV